MSAETIPSEVATDLDCIRWYVECLDAVAFKRRAVAGLAEAEGSYNAAMKRLTDRSTRPAEPAAPVAEAGDGECPDCGSPLNSDGECTLDLAVQEADDFAEAQHQIARLTREKEAERARADAAEQRAADALARAEKAKGALDVDAAMALIEGALKWANWCAGEGICAVEGEGVIDPDALLLAYSQSTDDEDWETLHERLPALLRASREAQPATDGGDNG